MQNQTIFELYIDDYKSNILGKSPRTFLSLQKHFMKNSTSSKLLQLLLLTNFLAKFLIERKCILNTLIFVRQKYL